MCCLTLEFELLNLVSDRSHSEMRAERQFLSDFCPFLVGFSELWHTARNGSQTLNTGKNRREEGMLAMFEFWKLIMHLGLDTYANSLSGQ